jgi:hypothetical protein
VNVEIITIVVRKIMIELSSVVLIFTNTNESFLVAYFIEVFNYVTHESRILFGLLSVGKNQVLLGCRTKKREEEHKRQHTEECAHGIRKK